VEEMLKKTLRCPKCNTLIRESRLNPEKGLCPMCVEYFLIKDCLRIIRFCYKHNHTYFENEGCADCGGAMNEKVARKQEEIL